MEIREISIKKGELDKVPEAARRVLIEQLIMLDEISVISAALLLSYPLKQQLDTPAQGPQLAQLSFFLRLLTAKLHEARLRLGEWTGDQRDTYKPSKEAKDSWDALNKTFGTYGDLFALVRNGFSFHHDRNAIGDSYDALPNGDQVTLWVELSAGIPRNDIMMQIASTAAENQMKHEDPTATFENLIDLVMDAATNFVKLLLDWTADTLRKHVPFVEEAVTLPEASDAFLPVFFDLAKATQAGTKRTQGQDGTTTI